MKIDFFSFESAPKELKKEWRSAISEVLESGQFIGGPVVGAFEIELSQYLGIKHAIGVGNGYDALVIALRTLEIGPGDFVAVPSHTFIATWLAVSAVGATPVGIDCDSSGLIDLELLETNLTTVSAVIPVHMHGQMVDMKRLMAWAHKKKVKVIEDCAQAHGAEIHGKKSGTWGDIGAFSFYPTKNLGAVGDAGALVIANDALAERARSIANYGSVANNKYEYQYQGINSRLDPIQASVLRVNLRYLDSWNEARKSVAKKYSNGLSKLGIKLFSTTPESVFHHYVALSENRAKTVSLLKDQGVLTEIHYPKSAENSYQVIKKTNTKENSPNANEFARKIISLPMSPWISDTEISYVLDQISLESIRRSFLGEMK
jgi:dTDP-4-amino-4,6-dideoxygalactose transaminase